ncbi:GntR family transcriptional regulator [Curtobacterium flaccumfaciens]|nr:GntR family transcriptional regulator [Curtobacterium flaccumfaciens]
MSRTPIREALAELARAGLIEMAPNRYTRVAAPTKEELLDAYRTLGVIYGGVVRLAVPRFTDAQRKKIVKMLDDVHARVSADEQDKVARDGAGIYAMWADACGNPSLVQLCASTTDGLSFKLRVPELAELLPADVILPELTKLKDAVVAKDPIAAELAMEAIHLLPVARLASRARPVTDRRPVAAPRTPFRHSGGDGHYGVTFQAHPMSSVHSPVMVSR